MFKQNVGTLDRDIRIALALFFFILAGFILKGILAIVALILMLLMLGTAAMGSCLIYSIFGINTCSADKAAKH